MKKYMYYIRNGKIEIYPLRHVKFVGVDTWVNKNVHKYFRFREDQVYNTSEEAYKAGEDYLKRKNNPDPMGLVNKIPTSDLERRIIQNKLKINEECMKKSQLKLLIKEVIKELHQTRQSSSDVYENFSVNLGGVVIPGISTENDEVEVITSIEYESEAAEPASGMFGPPENSSPGHGAGIDIIDYWVTDVLVYVAELHGEKKEYDFETLKPNQQQSVKNALIAYIESHEDKVGQDIMDKLGNEEPDYPESERDEI